jgi:glycerol-3-phosphate dehydrogenase (NAD(P)+)
MKKNKTLTVLGAGIWGSVLANCIAKKGYSVNLWEHSKDLLNKISKTKTHPNIKNFKFDKNINITGSLAKALDKTNLVLIALHSKGVRKTSSLIAKYINSKTPVVIASKGLEDKTNLTMSEVTEQELRPSKNSVMAISGPSFAAEVAKNIPTKLVLAGKSKKLLNETKKYFNGYPLSVETTTDRKTVELGGALKNVFAIACAMMDKKFGANTKAALIIQAASEMDRIMKSQGGKTKTAYGISGLGDLILTASSAESRNTQLGRKLAGGTKLAKAKKQIKTVTEGIDTTKTLIGIIRKKRLDAPITKTVYNIMRGKNAPESLLKPMGFKNAKRQRKRS